VDCLDDLLLRNNPRVEVAEGIRALRALHTTANVDAARHPAALPFSRHLPGGGTENRGAMGRQYVHLSIDTAIAVQVGRRKSSRPVILRLNARPAHDNGVGFYRGNDTVWLADFVPPSFIGEFGPTDR